MKSLGKRIGLLLDLRLNGHVIALLSSPNTR